MLSSSDDEARAVAVRCSHECEDHFRVAVDVELRGFKRLRRTQCEGGSRSPTIQTLREGWFQCLKVLIHGLASGSVSESFVPSSAGHVRRRVVVQSSETPVVDMTALDTDIDPDTVNSALQDPPPPPVWNEVPSPTLIL